MLEREIRLLLDENAVRSVEVVGSPSTTYTILINGRTVKSARRETRQFAKLDTVAAFLHKLGVSNFSVAMTMNSEANAANVSINTTGRQDSVQRAEKFRAR